MTSAHDVAREIRRRHPLFGEVKVHKLLYYAQGWHAVRHGEVLFKERVLAWQNGPVVASLWADEKHGRPTPSQQNLDVDQLDTVGYVLGRYGQFSGKQLIQMTHREDPWRTVSETDDPAVGDNPEITVEAMRRWFAKDTPDGAAARTRGTSRLDRIERTPGFESSLARVLSGERIWDDRPA